MEFNIDKMKSELSARCPERLITIDSHTAGEATRLIVGGVSYIPGDSMTEKLFYFKEKMDRVRLVLTREPRGDRRILAAAVTAPVSADATFGLIYMDARRYPYLCGHATIGAVTTLIEAGAIPAEGPEMRIPVDTPSGPMTARAAIEGDRVTSVGVRMVPTFVHETDIDIDVPGFGKLRVDTVCAGGFFAMVSADQTGLDLVPENADRLIPLGMAIIDAANEQITVRHPARPEVTTVDVTEFYSLSAPREGKSAVVYGESHMDRSPCGTGTSAKMALMHHKGQIGKGEVFTNHGPLGTAFDAEIVEIGQVGDIQAVEVEIRGSAHITGVHEFIIQPTDPLREGFLL